MGTTVSGTLRSLAIGLAVIFICWLSGDFLVQQLHLPLPGPVLGLVLLFLSFAVFPKLFAMVSPAGTVLLQNFPLFLYPVGASFLTLSGVGFITVLTIMVSIAGALILSITLCTYIFSRLKNVGR